MAHHDFDKLTLDIAEGVACITLNDPRVKNAMGRAMLASFNSALGVVAEEGSGARALILTGAGDAFSSGANLSDSSGMDRNEPLDAGASLEANYHPILRKLRDLPMPVITAVSGPAVGIGMSYALMGDIVIAARSAYFSLGFVKIGLVPDGGASWLLPRLIGLRRANELALIGGRLPADQALEWGLINEVCDDVALSGKARELAGRFAQGPTRALALMRRAFWASPENSYEEQLALEATLQTEAGKTEDFREGVAAFLAKRAPNFKGR